MRAELYRRLMEAEQEIAVAAYRRGVSDGEVQAALDAVDEDLSEDERRQDLYLAALARYVDALGGQLEVRAVFGDEVIVVHRNP
jgi:methanogenic corrinoid protein MtbC1